MEFRYQILVGASLLTILWHVGTFTTDFASSQKTGKSAKTTPPSTDESAKSATNAEKNNSPPSKGKLSVIKLKPNEGALVVIAVPAAIVTLARLLPRNKSGTPQSYSLTPDDKTLTLQKLNPGKYVITVSHPDFSRFTATVKLSEANPRPLMRT